jgi:hypothetical protein
MKYLRFQYLSLQFSKMVRQLPLACGDQNEPKIQFSGAERSSEVQYSQPSAKFFVRDEAVAIPVQMSERPLGLKALSASGTPHTPAGHSPAIIATL